MNAPDDVDVGASVAEWVSVVRRSRLHPTTKFVALLLATYANYATGENAYPGVAKLAIQSDNGYRTVQSALAQLRDVGLIEARKRTGLPRTYRTAYRLIFGPELLEHVDVPTPAAEDLEVERLAAKYRGKHRKKPTSARHLDGVQTDTETDSTARHLDGVQTSETTDDLTPPRRRADSGLHATHPPATSADDTTTFPIEPTFPNETSVVASGTTSARANEANEHEDFESRRQREMNRLAEWMRDHAEADTP